MKKFLLMFIFFISSCTSSTTTSNINFSDEMSFDEFKIKLEEYAKNNPYPNIDD